MVARGEFDFDSGIKAARQLLSRESRPTAIFAANDEMAAGVIRVTYHRNIDVPGELSVAGFDDSSLAQQVYPSLTTIRQPLATMAEQAAMALINDPGDGSLLHGTEVVPATLVIRDSTGPAPG